MRWRAETAPDGLAPPHGVFCNWWELLTLEFSVGLQSPVRLWLERDDQLLERVVENDRWVAFARPTLPANIVRRWQVLRETRAWEAGGTTEKEVETLANGTAGPLLRWWRLQRAGRNGSPDSIASTLREFDEAPIDERRVLLDELITFLTLRRSRQTLEASERLLALPTDDLGLEARARFVRASSLSFNHRLDEAKKLFRRTLRDAPPARLGFLAGDLWQNLGVAEGRSDNLLAAERALVESRRLDAHQGLPADPGILNNLGIVARRRGANDAALRYFSEALDVTPTGSRRHRELLVNTANLHKQVGAPIDALHLLSQLPPPPQEQVEEHLLWSLQLAEAQQLAGSTDRAAQILEPLHEIAAQQLDGKPAGARWENLRGDLARDRGEFEEALSRYAKGISDLETSNPGSYETAVPLAVRAELLLELGRETEAYADYLRACSVLDRSLPVIGGGTVGAADFRSRFWPIYRRAAEVALRRGDAATALAILRRSRRRQRLEYGGQTQREEQSRQADEIRDLAASMQSLSGVARDRARQELYELRTLYRNRFLSIAGSSREEPDDLDLGTGDLFVAYLLGDQSSWVLWQSDTDALSWSELAIGHEDLRERVLQLTDLLSRPAGAVRTRRRERLVAQLSGVLLTPLANALSEATRLLISPDGALHRLPMAILTLPESEQRLIERLEVVRVPDATAPASPVVRERPSRVVVAADPEPSDVLLLPEGPDLQPLPAARTEASAIRAALTSSAQILLGTEASEAGVLDAARRAEVLHLAAHTRADARFPLESAIYLAADRKSDGVLQAWELIESEPLGDLDLVVLSGCESALGRDDPGQGFLGLVDAFFSAGARRVMASLWRVNDASTALLMSNFYRALSTGSSPETALRRAQLSLMTGEHGPALRDPFHWAAFAINSAAP